MRPEPRVLVVDDDKEIVQLYEEWLNDSGFEVHVRESGPAALALCYEKQIDILVTDIHMPHVDGFALMRAVKKCHPPTKVIFISGHDDLLDAARSTREVDGILAKPLSPQTFLEMLKRLG